jgi:hypothetical protein
LIGRFAVRCTLIPDALLDLAEWGSGYGTAEGEHRCCGMWGSGRNLLVDGRWGSTLAEVGHGGLQAYHELKAEAQGQRELW